jgi:hypothetical protein
MNIGRIEIGSKIVGENLKRDKLCLWWSEEAKEFVLEGPEQSIMSPTLIGLLEKVGNIAVKFHKYGGAS